MDLGEDINVTRVTVYNRIDGDAAHASEASSRLSNSLVSLRNLQGYTLKAYEIGDAIGIPVFNISFDSHLGQTSSPTQSPTVFTPCSGMAVEIKVKTDYFPDETAWTLVSKCGANITLRSPPYSSSNEIQSTTACLPTGKYKFAITDTGGDGLCCDYGQGRYEILVNGTRILNGAPTCRFETKTFGACTTAASYLGCYIGELPYLFGQYLDVNGKTNCVQACFNDGYQYAGTKNSTECWCGNNTGNHGVDTYTNGCNMPCRGNAGEMCGGLGHSSVYAIAATLVHKVRIELEGQNHLHMREVQVFDQNNVNRALNKTATQSSTAIDCGVNKPASNALNGNLMDISHTMFESGKYWLLYHLLWA